MRKNNKKGFTLAELLIVVAIIAVLVAIAIPVFTNQLEKSREATDMANLRSAYAECSTALLTGSDDGINGVTYADATGTTPAQATKDVTLKQQQADWQTPTIDIAGVTDKTKVPSSGTVTVTAKADGTVTFTAAAGG